MTLDQLVLAAGLVDHVVTLDKLGRQYIGWLKNGEKVLTLVGADSCQEAIDELARRLDAWLRTFKPNQAPFGKLQALRVLGLPAPGQRSCWERLRDKWTEPCP